MVDDLGGDRESDEPADSPGRASAARAGGGRRGVELSCQLAISQSMSRQTFPRQGSGRSGCRAASGRRPRAISARTVFGP
jgi:hypothetical protein